MTNNPLTSREQTKIFIFILMAILTLFMLTGILPAIFLVFGIVLMKRNKNFSAIETSVRLVIGYLWVVLLICGGFSIYFGSSEDHMGEFIESVVASAFIIVYMFFVKSLYLLPLRNHREWVVNNGIFSSFALADKQSSKADKVKIIKGENLRSYSVADELSKWVKLRDEGVVSEQEFQEARNKILQSQ